MFALCVSSFFTSIYAQKQMKSDVLVFKNTYAIDAQDSKKEIIAKAVHIIPTDKQYEALKDEFIAFIHFGPNTFTKME